MNQVQAPAAPTASQLKALRLEKGLTQADAATLVEVPTRLWQSFEGGTRSIPLEVWEAFQVKALGVRIIDGECERASDPKQLPAPGEANLPRFVVHDLGDWARDELNTRSERIGGSLKEYAELEDVEHEADRSQLQWMLEHGELVTQCGNTVYQIRR